MNISKTGCSFHIIKVYYSLSITRINAVQEEQIPYHSENKPRGLYFLKALFEGLIFGGAYIRKGLSTEGNLRLKIDWAGLIARGKLTVFSLFHCVFEGSFRITSPRGAYINFGEAIQRRV